MRKVLARWWLDGVIILVVVAAGLAGHFWFLWHHHIAPEADYALHLSEAAAYQAVMDSPGDPLEKLVTAWTWPGPYPPMVYFVTWMCTWLVPAGSYASLASLSFFLVCLVVGAYLLGTAAGGRPVGMAAALLVQVDPAILTSMRRYWVDVPVTAMIVLSIASLVHARGFTSRAWSLAFGVALGMAMTSKFTACWYLTLPLLVALIGPVREADRSQRFWFLGLLAALAGVFKMLCAAAWDNGNHYMQGKDTMAPAFSYALVGAWLVACALYWKVVSIRLAGPLRHVSHALCVAGLLLVPWFLANQAMIRNRWTPATDLIPRNLAELPQTFGFILHENIPVILWGGLLGMLVLPFLKSRRAAMLPLWWAFTSGTVLTLVLLTCSARYRAPSQALLAIMAVSWLPRTRFVTVPVMALAMVLASVNLFTDMSLVRAPALGALLDRASVPARRFIVDQTDFPWTDFEPVCHELVAALPPTTSSIYVLTPRNDMDRLSNLFYMLLAENWWRGRVAACRLICTEGGRPENIQLCVLEPDRTRMLARRRGLPPDRFPRMFGDESYVPEIVLVASSTEHPEALAASIFAEPYKREAFPPQYGFAVLRCTGAQGRRPAPADAEGSPPGEPDPAGAP